MKQGKYESTGAHGQARRRRRRRTERMSVALLLAVVLLVGGVIGGTVAWLTADSGKVTNTFTESDIDITLSEENPTDKTAAMVPGWKIDKDPKVTVADDSEDCWLFVKITESTNPDLDAYIAYEIADKYDATNNTTGWKIVQEENDSGEIIIGRKVYKTDTTKEFGILGAGTYKDPMGTESDTADDFTITWGENQVCVKPSVTEDMMTAIKTTKPTLSFQAAAVQLYKTNSSAADAEFTAAEALARITWPADAGSATP